MIISQTTSAWVALIFAGLFEIGWAIGLKYTDGFNKLWPSLATLACMIASFQLLSMALRDIPFGTAYTIWTGIGAVGAVTAGVLLFGDALTVARLLAIALVLAGVVMLKLAE